MGAQCRAVRWASRRPASRAAEKGPAVVAWGRSAAVWLHWMHCPARENPSSRSACGLAWRCATRYRRPTRHHTAARTRRQQADSAEAAALALVLEPPGRPGQATRGASRGVRGDSCTARHSPCSGTPKHAMRGNARPCSPTPRTARRAITVPPPPPGRARGQARGEARGAREPADSRRGALSVRLSDHPLPAQCLHPHRPPAAGAARRRVGPSASGDWREGCPQRQASCRLPPRFVANRDDGNRETILPSGRELIEVADDLGRR